MDGFFESLRAEFSAERVLNDVETIEHYHKNTSAFKREILGVVKPLSTEEVQKVVAAANEFKVPLYAFSQGKNWGLGSKLPASDGCYSLHR